MATATVDLALNNSKFLAGMGEAERRSRNFESTVGSLFRRSPFQRAETALTEFALLLSSGNVIGAVQGLSARFSGLGLAASVGVGVALGAFKKIADQAKDAGAAVRNVNRELASPLPGGAGIGAAIDRDTKLLEALQNKRGTLGGSIALGPDSKALTDAQRREMLRFGFKSSDLESMRKNRADGQTAELGLQQRISELARKRSEYETRIADVKSKALTGDKLSAALLQSQLSAEEAIDQIRSRAVLEAQGPGRHNVLEDFANFSRTAGGINRLRQAQEIAAQRDFFQQSVRGFTPQTAATTENFLRNKIDSDPFGPGVKQMQLQADQLNLFRQNARLEELKNLEQNTIAYGPGARAFQERNRAAIDAQQQVVADQSNRVMKEQQDVTGNAQTNNLLIEIRNKMDEYWK